MLNRLRNPASEENDTTQLLGQLKRELADLRAMISELQERSEAAAREAIYAQTAELDKIIQQRLDERLNFYFRWRLPAQFADNGQTVMHTNDGHRLYVDTKEPFMTLHLLEHGEWEPHVRRALKQALSPGNIFIDVGANIGLHTLYAATLIGEAGRIFALEPHPVTRELCRKNLEVNGLLDRVTLLPFAVSDQDDATVQFEYFKEHPGMSGLKVAREILEKFSGTLEKVETRTITIDRLVERHGIAPDLIKIDVEGFEHAVLLGCARTIENHPNVRFLIEYEKAMAESVMRPGIGAEIASFFETRGFGVSCLDDNGPQPISHVEFASDLRGDYLFSRQV